MADFSLTAELRNDMGKGASRRLRREAGLVPAIVYGGKSEPTAITLNKNELAKQLENEAFYSHIVTLNLGKDEETVIVKDIQRHPAKSTVLHVDFMRIVKGQKFETRVPLHYINEAKCKGVKEQGAIVSHLATDVEVSCLPKDLPEYIEVDVIDCELGDTIHLSDIKFPEGVESVELSHGEDHDQAVASLIKPKGPKVEDEDADDADDAAEGEEKGSADE